MPTFVEHLEAVSDGSILPADELQTTHEDAPLVARYDLAAAGRAVSRPMMAARPATLWKWRELLPYRHESDVVSLGENQTPLLDCPKLAQRIGVRQLWLKDESLLPTGSFKARGMAMAVTMARSLGVTHVAAPTAGNAGGALAAYAARAGMQCTVLMPEDTPIVNQLEAAAYGARTFLVDGLIHQCGAIAKAGAERGIWFDMSTMKEPYRLEGKKTMGLELCEQLDWRLPDSIFYPTGGGTGLIGMWKAFAELRELQWLASDRQPRMYACQAKGCAPVVHAFREGHTRAAMVADAHTQASGLRVPKPFADTMILDCLRESKGDAIAADEDALRNWARTAMELEGVAVCPETGACLAALAEGIEQGSMERDQEVVVFNTGAAQKYVEVLQVDLPRLQRENIDWDKLS
ncbi:MAG: threonine synthase [Planctomycetota bacterium]|nr:threonine synthase [Planctomycetota bacterium]